MCICLVWAAPVQAKQWFMLSASENRCMDGTAVSKDLASAGLPPASSPYEFTEGLGRQRVPFTTSVTRDARGEVNAAQIVVSGRISLFWFPTREGCESARSWMAAKGYLVSPSELK